MQCPVQATAGAMVTLPQCPMVVIIQGNQGVSLPGEWAGILLGGPIRWHTGLTP